MPVDLVTRASHGAIIHPIETPQLSRHLCFMRVYLTKTGRHQAYDMMACRCEPVSCSECGPGAMDCSLMRMIAVSDAENVVLTRAIDAENVVLKTAYE